jgi:hypothetical protein
MIGLNIEFVSIANFLNNLRQPIRPFFLRSVFSAHRRDRQILLPFVNSQSSLLDLLEQAFFSIGELTPDSANLPLLSPHIRMTALRITLLDQS